MKKHDTSNRKFTRDDVRFFIFSWGPYTKKTEEEYRFLRESGIRVSVIDSHDTSPVPEWVTIGNNGYYGDQITAMLEALKEEDGIVFLMQADASHNDIVSIIDKSLYVYNTYECGVYAPDVYYVDPIYSGYSEDEQSQLEDDLYIVPATDCTFWSVHREVLKEFSRLDSKWTKRGWGIDLTIVALARKLGKMVIRDYGYKIDHPESTGYSKLMAHVEFSKYLKFLPQEISEDIRRHLSRMEKSSIPKRVWKLGKHLCAHLFQRKAS